MALLFLFAILYLGIVVLSQAAQECRIVLKTNDSSPTETPYENILWSDADDFIITERLGSGTFGEAFLAKNISSNEQFVIKIFKYEVMKRRKMMREIAILQHLCGHPNIVRLFHVVKQSLFGYPALVFESINNVDHEELYPNLSTTDIQYYAYELLKGIAFAHSRGIIHKDIKPSNVMIDHDLGILKIIDWGISDYYKPGVQQNIAGSKHFKSPEMLLFYEYATYSTDMWSYGCMLAALLLRKQVMFEGTTAHRQLHSIAKILGTKDLLKYAYKYDLDFNASMLTREFPRVPWQSVKHTYDNITTTLSSDAADFIDRLLRYDHTERITAQDALCHQYFGMLRNTQMCTDLASTGVLKNKRHQNR